MKHFFITGAPRSGTSWLANFFTQGRMFCFHEAILGCASVKSLRSKMDLWGKPVVGDSDSGLLHCLPALKAEFPDALLVLVHRNPLHVMASMERIGLPINNRMELLVQQVRQAREMADVVVEFEDVFGERILSGLWAKLCPDEPFSHERWEMLSRIQVQPDMRKYKPMYWEKIPVTLKESA